MPDRLFTAIANFPMTIEAVAAAATMMAVQILTTRQVCLVSHEDNILVGGRFNRCNFNLLAFLDSTQCRAGRTLRGYFLLGRTVTNFKLSYIAELAEQTCFNEAAAF